MTYCTSLLSSDILHELMEEARRAPPGAFAEVGVYKGGSARALAEVAREQGRRLVLFDTFSGIPYQKEGVDSHKVGDFSDTSLDQVRAEIPEAEFRVGIFPETLTDDVVGIALAHVDCDQYDAVRACCEHLAPRMAPGGVMVFDDPGCLTGASQAVLDCFPQDRVEVSRLGKWRVRFAAEAVPC